MRRIAVGLCSAVFLFGTLASARSAPSDEAARRIAQRTLIEGTALARIAPVTPHRIYARPHEYWAPHSKVRLRTSFIPELQRSIAALPE